MDWSFYNLVEVKEDSNNRNQSGSTMMRSFLNNVPKISKFSLITSMRDTFRKELTDTLGTPIFIWDLRLSSNFSGQTLKRVRYITSLVYASILIHALPLCMVWVQQVIKCFVYTKRQTTEHFSGLRWELDEFPHMEVNIQQRDRTKWRHYTLNFKIYKNYHCLITLYALLQIKERKNCFLILSIMYLCLPNIIYLFSISMKFKNDH